MFKRIVRRLACVTIVVKPENFIIAFKPIKIQVMCSAVDNVIDVERKI